jgi:hypothetical protein
LLAATGTLRGFDSRRLHFERSRRFDERFRAGAAIP